MVKGDLNPTSFYVAYVETEGGCLCRKVTVTGELGTQEPGETYWVRTVRLRTPEFQTEPCYNLS